MAPLRFSANLSWLFPELAGLPARLRAARSSGFEAAEVAWPYAEPPEALALAAREAGLRLVLINTPPGDQEKGEMGLGAVPGRQAAFREGLEQAVLYAKALGCPSIHLMAGRVPQGADRALVRGEMETVFLENLKHAAGVLAQENLVGLLEPINTRITDPQYFLDTPQQGRTPSPVPPPLPLDSFALLEFHGLLPTLPPSGSHLREGWKTQPPVTNGHIPLADHGREPDRKHPEVLAHCWACAGSTGSRPGRTWKPWRAELPLPIPIVRR
ncbi:putative hydroxypyruvate isomerase isoform X3 [Dasypus novemcinctus]|uniref:putative hydroxypyruvate isomerase isoform X3 n=1 Tax=Dasypus novemcinctus TaxID=9361 RepID=UPI00062A8CE7